MHDLRLSRDVGKQRDVLELGWEPPYHFDWIGGGTCGG